MKRLYAFALALFVVCGCGTVQEKPSETLPGSAGTGDNNEITSTLEKIKEGYKTQEQILPQHIKSIAIRPFVNKTSQLGLEDKLYLKVYERFVQDTRFPVVEEKNSDGVVVGEITHYYLQPLTYGPNFEVQQYKLRVLINLYFVDRVNNVTLWEERGFEGVHLFYSSIMPGGITEEEARDIVWEVLAQKIYRRVVEGFGSETGISEKKLPPQ